MTAKVLAATASVSLALRAERSAVFFSAPASAALAVFRLRPACEFFSSYFLVDCNLLDTDLLIRKPSVTGLNKLSSANEAAEIFLYFLDGCYYYLFLAFCVFLRALGSGCFFPTKASDKNSSSALLSMSVSVNNGRLRSGCSLCDSICSSSLFLLPGAISRLTFLLETFSLLPSSSGGRHCGQSLCEVWLFRQDRKDERRLLRRRCYSTGTDSRYSVSGAISMLSGQTTVP